MLVDLVNDRVVANFDENKVNGLFINNIPLQVILYILLG